MLNTAEVKLNDSAYLLRASNWARQLYAEEFDGKLRAPWTGRLDHDAAQLLAETVGDATEDGTGFKLKDPPEEIWGIFWALAAAGGSVTDAYRTWWERSVRDELTPLEERADLAVEVIDLLMRTFFRKPEEREGE